MTKNKTFTVIASLLVGLGLSGCAEEEVVELPPPLLPVKTLVISDDGEGVRIFPGRVEASRRAELSFRVPGQVAAVEVSEGDEVDAGQVIARLDTTDYKIALENARAEYAKAESEFERSGQLVDKGHISRRQYDRDERNYKQKAAAKYQAELNLSYCELRAPFSGLLARRAVENFQEVTAKQEIFSLRDLSQLEIRVDLPESIVRVAERDPGGDIHLSASFPLAGKANYPLTVKEVATRADPKTQTFLVKFQLPNPEGINLLSGMTALVKIDVTDIPSFEREISLPATALDNSGPKPQVWLFDPTLGVVEPRQVGLAQGKTSRVRVISGLEEGDRVVVAGVSSLHDGMAAYELPHYEQAEY